MDFTNEKRLVLDHYAALAQATPNTVADILAERASPDMHWRGMHPWHELHGVQAVADTFWSPLLTAFTSVQRRQDIFIGGLNDVDGFQSRWVASMGHLMGLFDAPFMGIPPTGRIAMLRYAEFNRVQNGAIVETAFFTDLLHLMRQAGLQPLPDETGIHLVQPGPMTHDGIVMGASIAAETTKTLDLINRMIGDINTHQRYNSPEEELAQCWHDDMIWWGPDGIGATYTIERYIRQHQQKFRTGILHRQYNGHVCRFADGNFGGFFGWPNLTCKPAKGYLGLPADGVPADMRVVDMYRRDGDKLAENWIFIDIPHFLNQQGVDVLSGLHSA